MKKLLIAALLSGVCFGSLFNELNVNMVKGSNGWQITSSPNGGGGGLINTNNEIWITTYGTSDGDGTPGNPLDWSQTSFDKGKGKTINIAAGTYYLDDEIVMDGHEWNDTVIIGVSAKSVKLISTNNAKRIFTVENTCTNVLFGNLDLESEVTTATLDGGAISVRNATIQDCIFNNCSSVEDGGAISVRNATIQDCIFNNCSSSGFTGGGAIYSELSTISDCTFDSCSSDGDGGGAIYSELSTISDCTFDSCSTSGLSGGAIYADGNSRVSNFVTYDYTDNQHNGIYFAGGSYGTAITTNGGFITHTSTSF